MSRSFLATRTRRFYRFLMSYLASELDKADLARPATVFAPHPDDETLGCGGTIIKKKRAGADVRIVFMTSGGLSAHHSIGADELRSIRVNEALAASRLLGVKEKDVVFLGFQDGALDEAVHPATSKVAKVLSEQPGQDIFVPYYRDRYQYLDHLAANKIVLSALQLLGRKATIYEYPVWFWWKFWPWTGTRSRRHRKASGLFLKSLVSGWSLLRDFRCSVYIGDVLELKRAALDEHKSQMTRPVPDARWPTLGAVSNGEFLECFFQEHEIFYRYNLPDQFVDRTWWVRVT